MDDNTRAVADQPASASEQPRPKRKVRRRTFKQIREEERAVLADELTFIVDRLRGGNTGVVAQQGEIFRGVAA